MAWVFFRLKLRLLFNGLRGRPWRTVAFVVGSLYGLLVAVAGFAVLAATRGGGRSGEVVAILAGTGLAAGWAVFPILGFASDETLDPGRLVLLPLRRRDLMCGLAIASATGIGGVATVVALSGAVVGFAPLGPAAAVVVLAALAQVVFCIALSRVVITSLSALLRSRRGRDLRVVLVAVVAFAPQLLRFAAAPEGKADPGRYGHLANVAGWLPSGLAMRAMVAASRGRAAPALVEVGVVVICIAGLVWLWSENLERIQTTPETPARRRSRSDGRGAGMRSSGPLFGSALAWLPRTRTGAVAAREIRAGWRDPRRRVQIVGNLVLPFLVLAGVLARGIGHRPAVVYTALLVVGLGGRAYNQIGFDGAAWWVHEAVGADLGADLTGKNVALAATTLPVVAVCAVVLAGLTGRWLELLAVLPSSVALFAAQQGVGDVLSVRAPWAVPASTANLWATNSGQGCLSGLLGLVGMAAQAVLAVPFAIALVVVHGVAQRAVVALVAVLAGMAVWRAGMAMAVRFASSRGPELLEVVSGR